MINPTTIKKFYLLCFLICYLSNTFAATSTQTVKDSLKDRRDEYFKGVQIVIDDKPANVAINKPYEKLTEEQKEHYLSYIPEKEKANGIQESDFSAFTHSTDASYYLDNKKSSLSEIIKHKREYYAGGGSKRTGVISSYYFYTYPYFEKNIKHINDHYPDKIYKITILNEALENIPIEENLLPPAKTYKRNGDTSDEQYTTEVASISYGYTDDIKSRSLEIMAHYPGGNDKFNDYLFNTIKVSGNFKEQQIVVSFIINTDGTLMHIFPDEKLDPVLVSEVIRVMSGSPRWIPAQKNGKPYQLGTRLYFKNKS